MVGMFAFRNSPTRGPGATKPGADAGGVAHSRTFSG